MAGRRAFERGWRLIGALALALLLLGAAALPSEGAADQAANVYRNPIDIRLPSGQRVESCADPSIIHGQTPGDNYWYIYCTTDPLRGADRDAQGNLIFHLIPIHRSLDLVNWTYVGDVFSARPPWVASDAGLWAPDIEYFNGKYYLYYTASNTSLPGGGSAIGVATASSPAGPWTDSGIPAVEPHDAPCCAGSRRWVFDPDVIEANGQKYIYYGSYFGGISARKLSADGLHSDPASQVQITIANRYEGVNIFKRGQYFYLFASATNCCNGPLTGYSVFAGRSTNPLGPFVDKDGVSLLQGQVGGTPVISMNGNRWVGPGHNAVFTDFAGQTWFLYHAVDQSDPYFSGAVGFTKRPALMDPLDWVNGWPTVRGGLWASDEPMPAPAARKGNKATYTPTFAQADQPGASIAASSDEFNGDSLGAQWSWVRQPADSTYGLGGGVFRFDTQVGDLYVDTNNASVLTEPTPPGDYIVETKVTLDLPPEGCCYNYAQAGLVIYGDDDNFIKLAHVSIWETRQTEFAKELSPVPAGYPRYGNTVVGPPALTTWLRIVKRTSGGVEYYRAYTSRDGTTWVRGGVWTHSLGAHAKIGLVSMARDSDPNARAFTAMFDYVRVYELADS
jgi:arabinan endo-1,5-alpha-L-arabinosidase